MLSKPTYKSKYFGKFSSQEQLIQCDNLGSLLNLPQCLDETFNEIVGVPLPSQPSREKAQASALYSNHMGFKLHSYGRSVAGPHSMMVSPNPFISSNDLLKKRVDEKMAKMTEAQMGLQDVSQRKALRHMKRTLKEMKSKVHGILQNNVHNQVLDLSQHQECESISELIHLYRTSPKTTKAPNSRERLPMIQNRKERIAKLNQYLDLQDGVIRIFDEGR